MSQVQEFLGREGLKSPGLNAKGLGGASIHGAQIYFHYRDASQLLWCGALVHRFRSRARPEVLESFRAEGKAGTDAGGGSVDYEAEAKSVFLARTYKARAAAEPFQKEMERLMDAAERWRRDVVPRVAERAFKRELK